MEGSSTPGSSAAQALQDLMIASTGGEENWLLTEISTFNVPVKRRAFPKEASSLLRDTLDVILTLALSLRKNSSMAFSAFSLFILFPRLLLRPLPAGCQGRYAEAAFRKRCTLFMEGGVAALITESHDAQTERVSAAINSVSSDTVVFSKTARAALLARSGEVGRACKVAFTYGLETDPAIAAQFLGKLNLQSRHSHIAQYTSSVTTTKNQIPLKAVTDAFTRMPKLSAAHRDGWTWELLRDAASRPSTAALLRKFTERFSNGDLPKFLWTYLASAIMHPFHKKLPEERTSITDPALRPVTVGSVITRFGCRVLVRMNRLAVAENLLLSHQFSFGIKGGVQQVILGINLSLQLNPSFVEIDLDLKNAHTFSSRDKTEEELESDIIYHYLLEVFKSLYGKTATPQWHYGEGPDRPPTSVHMSVDGFRQGDAPASVFFNILAARIYRKQLATLDGRGVLFAIVDDVKIAAPPHVIAEIVDSFSDMAWNEAGLTTQAVKNRIYVQPSAREGWINFLDATPRDPSAPLQLHDIPDGSSFVDPFDTDSRRIWPEEDGINVLGTPLGSPDFIDSYLFGKGIKHRQLLTFIQEVATAGYPREALSMLTGAACPRLTHILKSTVKNERTEAWMKDMDSAHLSTWLHCLTSSSVLEQALDPIDKEILTEWLDLPYSYGGAELKSLSRSADEEFIGSFAAIASSLISFCRKTNLPIYIRIAEALEALADPCVTESDVSDGDSSSSSSSLLLDIRDTADRVEHALSPLSAEELNLATQLIKGHSVVETPGNWNRNLDQAPDCIVLPETRLLTDFITAPCKHEVSLMKQTRHVRQANSLYNKMDSVRKILLRATAGQCGRDSAHCSDATVKAVATMECPASLSLDGTSDASLFCAATLHRYGLPHDFARMEDFIIPETCACCHAPIGDPNSALTRSDRIFIWQCHMGRCGGDGRRIHAHESVKLAVKKLVLCCPDPVGCAFPSSSVLIEPRHLRQDNSRPGDIFVMGNGMHRKDTVMDIVLTTAIQKSCLNQSITSSDYVIRKAENEKFGRDSRSVDPIQLSPTMRFIPLAMNHLGLRGSHFNAALREFASQLVLRPNGCSLLSGPFALSLNGALRKLLFTWGARLTWTAQRHHAAQILLGMDSFFANASFLSAFDQENVRQLRVHPPVGSPGSVHLRERDSDSNSNMGGGLGIIPVFNPVSSPNLDFGHFDQGYGD